MSTKEQDCGQLFKAAKKIIIFNSEIVPEK